MINNDIDIIIGRYLARVTRNGSIKLRGPLVLVGCKHVSAGRILKKNLLCRKLSFTRSSINKIDKFFGDSRNQS